MKNIYCLFILFVYLACHNKEETALHIEDLKIRSEVLIPEFQSLLDSTEVEGSILIYDHEGNILYSNNFERTTKGYLPASTFKIPNSIIALETGVVESDRTIFRWNGEPRGMEIWEQDLTFRDAFQYSCVPCYQEVARTIGTVRMRKYLDTLAYGDIRFDSTSVDRFWLQGNSKITQREQIDFLVRLYRSELPIARRTDSLIKYMMKIDSQGQYTIRGKTGWSINNEIHNGWFVGYVEQENNTYFFATNIEPKETLDMATFPTVRKKVTYQALQHLKIIDKIPKL